MRSALTIVLLIEFVDPWTDPLGYTTGGWD
jgi:hypothetical protein